MVARSRFIYSLIFLCVSLLAKDEQCICTGFSVLRENLRIPSTRSIRQTRKESPIPHQSPSVSELNQGKETEQDEHEGSLQQQPSSSSSSVKSRTHFWTKQLLRQLFAEAIGTFIIVQMGTCAVMSAIFDGALVGLFQIASVWIIAVTVAIASTGPISGAHLNPAMSVAFAVMRPSDSFRFGKKLLLYIVAQLIGAICGSWINFAMFSKKILQFEAKSNIVRGSVASIASAKAFGEYFVDPVTPTLAFFVELVGTGILALIIFSLTNPKNDLQQSNNAVIAVPALIGMTVGGIIAGIAPLTQCGLNPARDFGPRIVAYLAGWKGIAFKSCWVYVVAPVIGALIGAFVSDKVLYGIDDNL